MTSSWRVACLAVAVLVGVSADLAAQVDFQRQIRPILSDNCFQCHGPDPSTRMANLRLDLHGAVLAPRRTGAPVVPGKPDESLIYKRITEPNVARRMPPLSAHKTLTDAQKAAIRTWIEQGAAWNEHWAFVAPARPPLPANKNQAWARNPIDRFVAAKLEAAGLAPNPEADRRALIRRVSLDLTGLPPTPAEVSAFVADKSPDAYAKVVERLLASPHYGEHRARYWLDAARYGDTNGLHYDNYRGGIWPYRDWVVRAFNRNQPFDQFTVEQLAGDLLPEPTLDQLIATGFVRNNTTTNENGVIEDEIRFQYVKDRADTTGTVFLGLTVACATCHDHKFDPISQKDHYALEAFFNNTTERVMDLNRPDPPPIAIVPPEPEQPRWVELERLRKTLRGRLERLRQAPHAGFDAWLASPDRARLDDLFTGAHVLAIAADADQARVTRGREAARVPLSTGVELADEAPWNGQRAFRFAGRSAMTLRGISLTGAEPFSMSAWIYLPEIKLHPGQTGAAHALAIAAQLTDTPKLSGWVLEIDEGVARLRLIDEDGKTIRAQAPYNKPVAAKSWNHLTFTYDGSGTEDGYSFYLNGQRLPTTRGSYGGQDAAIATALTAPVATGAPLTFGASVNGDKALDALVADFRILDRVLSEEESRLLAAWPAVAAAAAKPAAALTAGEREALKLYYLMRHDADYRTVVDEFTRAGAEHRAIELRSHTAMVMEERPDSKATAHVLYRGMYDQPRELVEAATPSFLPPMAADLPRNRLGLARWIVDPANPLFARVTVNRFWQELFGAGLVESAEDFGAQAQPPSHPELLDWLAVEFRESGWDVKQLMRTIVASAAYRQSAAISPGKLQKDPKNVLLSRGPRIRLDGEVVRDAALYASGLLVPKLGGPPVKPYQPAGVWEITGMVASNTRHYTQDTGESLYRRSLYTLWKRSAPPASMEIFDGPTREVCVVRRDRTNTPLQALVTMNDPQFVEAARVLAQNAMRAAPGTVAAQIDFMTTRVVARTFSARERGVVQRAYDDLLTHYRSEADAANQLLGVGESPADASLPAPELAALTMIANQLFSLDEALNK